MKKIIAMMLALMMVLSMTACGAKPQETEPQETQPEEAEPATQATETVPTTEAPAPEPVTPPALTQEEFLKTINGLWIVPDSVRPHGDTYYCNFMSFGMEYVGSGSYPGEGSSGKIVGFRCTGENLYELDIYYEAVEEMYEYYPAEQRTITVLLQEGNTMEYTSSSGYTYTLVYGCPDLEQLGEAAGRIYNQY